MAGAKITLDVDDRQVLEALGSLIHHTGDLAPAYREISEVMSERTRARIERGGPAPDGTPWEPLKSATIKRKKQNKHKILIEYGYLLGSIHPRPSADEAVWGTNRVYAAAMQFGMSKGYAGSTRRGSPIPWGDIPARPFLGLSNDDRAEVLDILHEYLQPSR